MGQIVAAMATVHAPQLFTRPPEEDPRQLDADIAAMGRLGTVLDETRPDALVIFGSDHLETFFLQSVPTFAVIAGERATAAFAGRTYAPPIHRALAEDLLDQLIRVGFDMAYSQEALLGHSFAAPFEWVLGVRQIPVVPVFINTYLPPLPSPRRCAALGKATAEIVAARPERVALLASGGMSHYPGTWRYYQPDYAFDRRCIEELENGNSDAFLNLTVEQLDEVGNTEMLPWAAVLGAIGEQHMELLTYQPTSHHGHAVARFHPGPPAPARPRQAEPYRFRNEGYEFYKHPPLSSYKLNKLLYESRHKPALRQRMLQDMDAVGTEYGLTAAEIEALRPLSPEPLVKAGAHPLGALMAVHVLQADRRKLQAAAKGAGAE
jgi:aromatic ring-opening dioxygenase catalytic subunit (LigB family)